MTIINECSTRCFLLGCQTMSAGCVYSELTSSGLEHHDHVTLVEDITWRVDLEAKVEKNEYDNDVFDQSR